MKFMIFVIDDQSELAKPDEMAAIDIFNDSLRANGHWLTAGGLTSPKFASLIDNRAGANITRAGSLFNEVEHFSGFWLIEANDVETAVRLATEGSRACNRKVELRPLLG